jgi:hypothetical protein
MGGWRFLLLVLLLTPISIAQSSENGSHGSTSPREVRSIIGQGVGHAFVGSKTSEEKGWRKAAKAARSQVLRQTKKSLRERITARNSNLSFEIKPSSSGKVIRVLKEERLGIDQKGKTRTFKVRVVAELNYRLVSDLSDEQLLAMPDLPLTVRIWTDKRVYREGSKIVFHLQGNRDFYARAFDIAVDGTTIQLLPNAFRTTEHFKGGKLYSLPDPAMGDDFDFEVSPPLGKEDVLLFASEAPLGDVLFAEFIGGMFGRVEGSLNNLTESLKNLVPNQQLESDKKSGFRFVEFVKYRWRLATMQKSSE